jgi:hypothetical protein
MAANQDDFGTGWTDDQLDTPISDSIPATQEAMAGIVGAEHAVASVFDFDPAEGDSSDDYDFNHDGVVDHHDARAALHSVHTFHVEAPPEPDLHDHEPGGLHEAAAGIHDSVVHGPDGLHGVHDAHVDHADPATHHPADQGDHHLDFFHH